MRKSGLIYLTALFAIISGCKKEEGLSDSDKKQFFKVYGTGSEGVDIKQTSDGGYLMLGTTQGLNSIDLYLKKVDAFGNDVWSKSYDGPQGGTDEEAAALEISSDGKIFVLGSTFDGSMIKSSYLLILDASGNESGYLVLNSGNIDESETAYCLTLTSNQEMIIGSEKVVSAFNKKFLVGIVRTFDLNIGLIDTLSFDRLPADINANGFNFGLRDLIILSSGEVVVTGYSDQPGVDGSGGNGVILSVFDKISQKSIKDLTFGNTDDDLGRSLIQSSTGSVLIAGYETVGSSRKFAVYTFNNVLASSPEANPRYVSTTAGNGEVSMIAEVSDGFVLVGYNDTGDDRQFYIEKINSGASALVWKKEYGSANFDEAKAVISTMDNGLAVLGTSSDERGNKVMTLLKLDANGNLK